MKKYETTKKMGENGVPIFTTKNIKKGPIPVFIFCHWHTGSSLISRALEKCGMFMGNENTVWDETCEINCEHSLMNNTMADILYQGVTPERLSTVKDILVSYNKEAGERKNFCYGFKVTHGLQVWEHVQALFEKHCPNAKYIIGIRDPRQIIRSVRKKSHSDEWPDERVSKSWVSVGKVMITFVKKGAFVVDCPSSWANKARGMKNIVRELGMTWSPDANNIFDLARTDPVLSSNQFGVSFHAKKQYEILRNLAVT